MSVRLSSYAISGAAGFILIAAGVLGHWTARLGGAPANPEAVPLPVVSQYGPRHDVIGGAGARQLVHAPVSTAAETAAQPAIHAPKAPVDSRDPGADLMGLAMNEDAASLERILAELRNPNRERRAAALRAAIQFGSRDAIPQLAEAAAAAHDANEKAELRDAIEFLKLPSLSEVLARRAPAAPEP